MADSSVTTRVAAGVNVPTIIPHTRLGSLSSLYGLFVEQRDFFFAVDNGDVAARAKLFGSEGIKLLRDWMGECKVELVSSSFLSFVFLVF
jgi:hypothetical protein